MRAETARDKLADIPAEIFQFVAYNSTSHESTPQPRIASQFLGRQDKGPSCPRLLKFRVPMPTETNADVLRRHGFLVLADWAENALIAPRYLAQSQYWASVLWEPEIPEFAEWPMEGARGWEFDAEDEAELPEADLPLLVPVFGTIPAVVFLNTSTSSAPPACQREPTRECGRTNPRWGVVLGFISC